MSRRTSLRQLALQSIRSGSRLRTQFARNCAVQIIDAARLVATSLRHGHKVLLFGNGGSAADAQHIAAELLGRFSTERRPLPSIALAENVAALTAIANDYGFEHVFSRQIQALGRPGDVAVGISTSGASPNVIRGVSTARARGLATIALTVEGTPLARQVDCAICVPPAETPRVQECHITAGHILCQLVETLLADDRAETAPPVPTKVTEWDQLLLRRQAWREAGMVVVWTNGCFDLLHVGHVRSLTAARTLGDVLVVGLNSDSSVRALKGSGRPIVPEAERAEVLASLEVVDAVVVFDELTPEAALDRLRPEVHVKGGDYAPPDGRPVPEAPLVESYGGRVVFLPFYRTRSTSGLARRIGAQETAGS